MKKLLLFSGLVLSSLVAQAQLSCETATTLPGAGTYTAPAVTGTYGNDCYGGTLTDADGPLQSVWYSYTPIANGNVTVSSDLAINVPPLYSNDTRISVFTGTCAALECYTGNDDVSATNYKSSVTFAVAAGTTYYISWDNYWNASGFQFSLSFVAASCFSPGIIDFNAPSNITTTGVTLSWDPAIGPPANYDVDYGAIGHVVGTGTVTSTANPSLVLSGLPPGGDYDYFVRGNCGDTQAAWMGPYKFYLAKTAPYANNFDTVGDNLDGFVLGTGFSLSTSPANAAYAHSGSAFIFSNKSTTAAANAYAFLRPMSLAANEMVTIKFWTRWLGDEFDPATVEVTVGNEATSAAQTTLVQNFPEVSGLYTERTAVWTAPAPGTYVFAVHHNSPMSGDAFSLLFDTFSTTSVLSTGEFTANTFAVYPNPANEAITISNNDNILVTGVSIADINGRVVKQVNTQNSAEPRVNVSDLSAGLYLMTISSESGSVTKKFVKN